MLGRMKMGSRCLVAGAEARAEVLVFFSGLHARFDAPFLGGCYKEST